MTNRKMMINFGPRWLAALLPWLVLSMATLLGHAQDAGKFKEFSKPVIDIGIVVRDAEESAKFYTEAIGFTEVKGFHVSGDLGRRIGLIDNHPVDVRVFVLGDGDRATRVKLLAFPQAPGRRPDQTHIHSTLGLSYLTLYVSSADRALERLQKAGIKPIGDTPVALGGNTRLIAVRDPDGNFLELIGP